MADTASEFLKGARAMDDFPLQQRIRAAVLYVGAGKLGQAITPARNYAVAAFLNPTRLDSTMLALVCVETTVAGAVVVPEDGTAVDTSKVTDSVILAAVNKHWATVAAKYQADPLATPAQGTGA